MTEWTPEQQNEFSRLYSSLEHQPHYDKKAAYKALFEEQLPFNEAKKRLEEIIAGPKKHGIEAKADHSGIFSGRVQPAAGLAAVLVAVALASMGMPYGLPIY